MVLERYAATNFGPWYVRHAAGLVCVVLGGVSILAAFWMQFGEQKTITEVVDLRVTLPLLVLAIAAGVFSFVRRERLRPLPIAGMAMAAAAPLIGWVILVAIVGIVAVVAALIIAKFH